MEKLEDFIKEKQEINFDDLYKKILNSQQENSKTLNKIEAREFLEALLQIEEENEFLEKEYLSYLRNKYLNPVFDRIDHNKNILEDLRKGLLSFMDTLNKNSFLFPDLAEIRKVNRSKKIGYPSGEECEKIAKKLYDSGNKDYVNIKYSLNKTLINKNFKESLDKDPNSSPPLKELSIEEGENLVKIFRKTNENEDS